MLFAPFEANTAPQHSLCTLRAQPFLFDPSNKLKPVA